MIFSLGWLKPVTRKAFQASVLSVAVLSTMVVGSFVSADAHGGGFRFPSGHEMPSIHTSGHGKVTVTPDSFRANANVRSQAKTLLMARKDNQTKVKAILTGLKGLNIPQLKLKTTGFNTYPVYESIPGKVKRLRKIIGYKATTKIEIKGLAQPEDQLADNASRALDAALNAGAKNVGQVQFFRDDKTAFQREAMAKAVKDVVENATVMASAAGVAKPTLFTLNGSPQFNHQPVYRRYARSMMAEDSMGKAASPAPPLEVGETTISATVSAIFHFDDGKNCPFLSRWNKNCQIKDNKCKWSKKGADSVGTQACPYKNCPDKKNTP